MESYIITLTIERRIRWKETRKRRILIRQVTIKRQQRGKSYLLNQNCQSTETQRKLPAVSSEHLAVIKRCSREKKFLQSAIIMQLLEKNVSADTKHTETYSFAGVPVHIACKEREVFDSICKVIEETVIPARDGIQCDGNGISIFFNELSGKCKIPPSAQGLSSTETLRVFVEGEFTYLLSDGSIFKLDVHGGRGEGFLTPSFMETPAKSRQDFVVLALLWLLRKQDIYGIHANGVEIDGKGILFIGDTGCGKSTTMLSLIRQGYRYLSDDIILIRKNSGNISAFCFQKGISFDPQLAGYFPELDHPSVLKAYNGKKSYVELDKIYQETFLTQCVPRILIFPRITHRNKSWCEPLEKTTALVQLLKYSGGSMVDKFLVSKQIEVLKELVTASNSYILYAGRDVFMAPESFQKRLCETVI